MLSLCVYYDLYGQCAPPKNGRQEDYGATAMGSNPSASKGHFRILSYTSIVHTYCQHSMRLSYERNLLVNINQNLPHFTICN